MTSRNRLFAELAKDIDTDGNITSDGLAAGVGGAVTIFSARADLPASGNTAGDQAYVTANNRLYIWNGSGWYNVALLNVAPSISSVADSAGNTTPFALSAAGNTTTITITATDSDGDPLTFNASADNNFNGIGTISQSSNVFTITPLSQDSATTSSGTITFTATDGVNTASSGVQTFTLAFVSSQWADTVLSIGTSSTNSLDNDTFIDRSTNTHSPTVTGTGMRQTAFHPYLDNWSTYFDDGDNSSVVFGNLSASDELGTGAFTIEAWVNPLNLTNNGGVINYGTYTAGLMLRVGGSAQIYYNSTSQNVTMPAIGVWSHICLERDGSNNWAWYINGVQEDTWTSSTSITGSGNALQIGRNNHNGSEDFYGWISNVRVVKGSRVYGSAFTPPTEKLTAVSGTTFLGMQDNRFKDNSTSARAVSAINATPKISAFNPFGQLSEYATGANKGACEFDATGNYIDFASDTSFAFGTSDYTVEWWHWQTAQQWGTIFDTSDGSNYTNTVFIATSGSAGESIQAYHSGGARATGSDGGAFPLYQWTHCAVTRESGTVKIYINGKLDGQGTGSEDLTQYGATVGRATYWTSSYDMRNGSMISDLKVTKGTAVYTTSDSVGTQVFTPPTSPAGSSSASLYLPFDNAGIFDKTGNDAIELGGNTSTSTTQKKYASTSMYFDGTGDYSRFEVPPIRQQNYTMEAWIYPTSVSGYRRIMGTQTDSVVPSTGYMFRLNGNQLQFSSGGYVQTTTTLTVNNWHHIALVRSGATTKIYLNGVEANASHTPASASDLTDTTLYVGLYYATNNTEYFQGYIENPQLTIGVAKYTTNNFTPPTQTQGRLYQATS